MVVLVLESWTTTPVLTSLLVCVVSLLLALPLLWKKPLLQTRKNNEVGPTAQNSASHNDATDEIPTAPGAIFLLGHALAYKRDPVGFLKRVLKETDSPLLRINLAGQKLILLDPVLATQVASKPDAVLSLRQAVQDYGFGHTLGKDNVHQGTEWHKRIIKQQLDFNIWGASLGPTVAAAIRAEANLITATTGPDENAKIVIIPDLFSFLRRVLQRTVLQSMVGLTLQQDETALMDEIYALQEQIEDATAATAVLPTWLAHPLMLLPTQQQRLALQAKLVQRLNEENQKNESATNQGGRWWLHAMADLPVEQQAEFIVGLLFAGAKNPALGAAQTLCFLLDHSDGDLLTDVRTEATGWKKFLAKTSWQWSRVQSKCPLTLACIQESTRLTALAIGSLRKVLQPVTLTDPNHDKKTWTLQPGETVALSLIVPNTDEATWSSNAMEFHPRRFLESTVPSVWTFSHGTHHCPGERVATILMHTVVTQLLADHRIQLACSLLPALSWERATVAQRAGPVPVRLTVG